MNPEYLPLFPDSLHTSPAIRIRSPNTKNMRQTGTGKLQRTSHTGLPSQRKETKNASFLLSPQSLALSPLLFTGEARVMAPFALSHATRWLLKENAVLRVVDAGNVFNPYVIARSAQRAEVPAEDWLRRVFVARAFTPYQSLTLLENLCENNDTSPNGKSRKERLTFCSTFARLCDGLLILLPFEGLEDPAFSWRERTYLAQRILTCLRVLATRQTGFTWIVERDSAPFLDSYFRSLSHIARCQVHGILEDHRLSLRIRSRSKTASCRGGVKPYG